MTKEEVKAKILEIFRIEPKAKEPYRSSLWIQWEFFEDDLVSIDRLIAVTECRFHTVINERKRILGQLRELRKEVEP